MPDVPPAPALRELDDALGRAPAGGQDTERLPGELAEVVRQAGRDQRETLRAEGLPVAGITTAQAQTVPRNVPR